MTYIDDTRSLLAARLANADPALLDLYTLLVLVRGEATTLSDVHDAWALWRSHTRFDHPSIVPFAELTEDVQRLDLPYAHAIHATARHLRSK